MRPPKVRSHNELRSEFELAFLVVLAVYFIVHFVIGVIVVSLLSYQTVFNINVLYELFVELYRPGMMVMHVIVLVFLFALCFNHNLNISRTPSRSRIDRLESLKKTVTSINDASAKAEFDGFLKELIDKRGGIFMSTRELGELERYFNGIKGQETLNALLSD